MADGKGGADGAKAPEIPDLTELGQEIAKQLGEIGKQVKETFDKVSEEAQYAFDREMGKLMAKNPELYAEIRKTMRQAQRTLDEAAKALGLDKLGK